MMKTISKRSLAFMMAVFICTSLFFCAVIHAQCANVDYVYSGNYIKNWGERDAVCTFLSPNAENFYKENSISLEALLLLSGSNDVNSVPSSELYAKLKELMASNHSHQTTYGETRDLYQYTDCQNSGKTNDKISSFYSGKEVGPAWDSGKTWNREHTWPNSKGLAGNDENDIMMLRPTSVSENSSRGNKAYGESGGFYNPNKESNGAHNLHGDVARIALYQYVRWGNTSYMWGSSGVIESKEILLKWMQEDPVDTWELGRNDSVEAITGTRNVFVDLPELAFALFDAEIPSGYETPSQSAKSASSTTSTGTTAPDTTTGLSTTGESTLASTDKADSNATTANNNTSASENDPAILVIIISSVVIVIGLTVIVVTLCDGKGKKQK